MKKKLALILGANGQDASYLAELLIDKDYEVHGTIRRNSVPESQTTRIQSLRDNNQITLHYMDLTDPISVESIINDLIFLFRRSSIRSKIRIRLRRFLNM